MIRISTRTDGSAFFSVNTADSDWKKLGYISSTLPLAQLMPVITDQIEKATRGQA